MAFRSGSWDSFAQFIRWSQPPSRPVRPSAPAPPSASPVQAPRAQPRAVRPAPAPAGQRQEGGLKAWLEGLFRRLSR